MFNNSKFLPCVFILLILSVVFIVQKSLMIENKHETVFTLKPDSWLQKTSVIQLSETYKPSRDH